MTTINIGQDYEISDELWKKIEPLLPPTEPKKISGRPRKDDRKIMSGIFYIFCTGNQWKSLPRVYGAPSTVHDRFQEWKKAGLFDRMAKAGLLEQDIKERMDSRK
jgi:transposase